MTRKRIQDYLFQRIRERLPTERSLVDTIAEALCISQDSAYRRIRGETLLVLEEASILCQQFNISLDHLLQLTEHSIVFRKPETGTSPRDFTTFLKGVLHELKALSTCQEKSLIYVSKDVPLFLQMCSKSVFSFHYYIWMRNVFQHPDFLQQPFSVQLLPADVESLGQELLSLYCKIPSTEIWCVESVNSILQQMNYCLHAGTMSREAMTEVSDGLHQALEHLQVQATYGRKFIPGEDPRSKKENFQLFYNRMGLSNNTILTCYDGKKTVYLNHESLSYIDTSDESFCDEVHQQLQDNMRRSTLISSVSEKQRNIFFNALYAKLPRYRFNNAKMAS
jgi:hypothetical protein